MVYLDGTKLTSRAGLENFQEAMRIINGIPVPEIAGIEIYPGAATVPGEFAGLDTNCGVLVVWTRASDHTEWEEGGGRP